MSASNFELADLGFSGRSVSVEGVPGATVVQDVLSADECEQLIAGCEKMGFTKAPLSTSSGSVMRPDLRDNDRVMFEFDDETLGRLAKRVSGALPKRVYTWVLDEEAPLNERIRVYRYAAHQKFAPHFDGAFSRSRSKTSMLTMLVYLNEGFEGGTTTFFPDGCLDLGGRPGMVDPVDVLPETGKALLFHHGSSGLSPLHQGTRHVSEGKYKYVLRTDIMYKASDDGFEWMPESHKNE